MVWCSAVMTASEHLESVRFAAYSYVYPPHYVECYFLVTSKTKQRQSGRSDGTLTVFFLVRRRNLRSWAEACLQNSSRFCSQRHWLTPMFSLFSIHYITHYITLYLLFVLLVVTCLDYGRSVNRSLPYSRVYFPVIFDSFTSHCSLLFRSTFSLIHIINQSLIDFPSWCYNNSIVRPRLTIVSEHLSFSVNIAVSGLCNFTYFCLFVLHCIHRYLCIRFCQQPLCLFQFCHWAELSFINTRGVRNSRLGAVRYGAYKCSSTISGLPTARVTVFPVQSRRHLSFSSRTGQREINASPFFWPWPLHILYLWPEFDLLLLLYFLLFLVGLQSNSWCGYHFKNIVCIIHMYRETLHAE